MSYNYTSQRSFLRLTINTEFSYSFLNDLFIFDCHKPEFMNIHIVDIILYA